MTIMNDNYHLTSKLDSFNIIRYTSEKVRVILIEKKNSVIMNAQNLLSSEFVFAFQEQNNTNHNQCNQCSGGDYQYHVCINCKKRTKQTTD